MGPICRRPGFAEASAPTHDQPAIRIQPKVQQQLPGVGRDVSAGEDGGADIVGQWRCRDLEAVHRNHAARQARDQGTAVAVGADHHTFSHDAVARLRDDMPFAVLPMHLDDR